MAAAYIGYSLALKHLTDSSPRVQKGNLHKAQIEFLVNNRVLNREEILDGLGISGTTFDWAVLNLVRENRVERNEYSPRSRNNVSYLRFLELMTELEEENPYLVRSQIEIADLLGVKKQEVNYLHQRAVTKQVYQSTLKTQDHAGVDNKVLRCLDDGIVTKVGISRETGLSYGTVKNAIDRLIENGRIVDYNPKKNIEQRSFMIGALRIWFGMRTKQISEITGWPETTIEAVLDKYRDQGLGRIRKKRRSPDEIEQFDRQVKELDHLSNWHTAKLLNTSIFDIMTSRKRLLAKGEIERKTNRIRSLAS